MSYLLTTAETLAAAATDAAGIDAAIGMASAAAAAVTTDLPAAAGDEVSAATAAAFSAYAQGYQRAAKQAAAFHHSFTRALAAAGSAYAQTEAANATLTAAAAQGAAQVALIMGGTDIPYPDPAYTTGVQKLFIEPHYPGYATNVLYTPEQLWPFTAPLGNLRFGQSVAQGVALLDSAITTNSGPANSVVVYGYSQSATVATIEIRALMASGAPHSGQLAFVLTGDPNNPDGGFFERFPGLYVPILDMDFSGATPPGSPYPTYIYSAQYDGVADFPQYPLNVLSDVNAIMGAALGQHDYAEFSSTVVAGAVPLPTSPGYAGNTHYYLVPSQNVPLLSPLRHTYPGSVLADLMQPDLRVLVDLGYGNLADGYDYADVPTPAALFSLPDPFVVLPDLARGTVQGAQAALVDVGWLPQSDLPDIYPYVPSLDPGLHVYLGQPTVTGLSLLTGRLGEAAGDLGLIPSWD